MNIYVNYVDLIWFLTGQKPLYLFASPGQTPMILTGLEQLAPPAPWPTLPAVGFGKKLGVSICFSPCSQPCDI